MMFKKIALFVVIALGIAHAQGAASISQVYKPGDNLHYYVTFDGEIKDVRLVSVMFNLEGQAGKNQEGFQQGWRSPAYHKVSENVYEVDTPVPNVVSGTYRLASVIVETRNGGGKGYAYKTDFKDDITIRVNNEAHNEYPTIKSVSPNPPKQ